MPFLRPEVVKLDLRLVQARPGPEVAEIMSAVAAYAEHSEALVLAEGVENAEHLADRPQPRRDARPGLLVRPGEPASALPGIRAAPARPALAPSRRPRPARQSVRHRRPGAHARAARRRRCCSR